MILRMTGQRISHFEVLEKLSEGGMGVVYKARDLDLNRLAALKMPPDSVSADPARRQRVFAGGTGGAGAEPSAYRHGV